MKPRSASLIASKKLFFGSLNWTEEARGEKEKETGSNYKKDVNNTRKKAKKQNPIRFDLENIEEA